MTSSYLHDFFNVSMDTNDFEYISVGSGHYLTLRAYVYIHLYIYIRSREILRCSSAGDDWRGRVQFSGGAIRIWWFSEKEPERATQENGATVQVHDDVIKWKHFPCYWPFVQGIHRSPVNSQHKGQWRRALMFSLIYTRINGRVNNGEAGDLRRHRAHYDVTVMRSAENGTIK